MNLGTWQNILIRKYSCSLGPLLPESSALSDDLKDPNFDAYQPFLRWVLTMRIIYYKAVLRKLMQHLTLQFFSRTREYPGKEDEVTVSSLSIVLLPKLPTVSDH